jgi:hypothetical protein
MKTLGQTMKALARRVIARAGGASARGSSVHHENSSVSDLIARYGIHPLPARGGLVSNEMIAQLRENDSVNLPR